MRLHSVMFTLCNSVDCSLPGFSVRRILQARILEWVAISFSRRSSQLGIEPAYRISCTGRGIYLLSIIEIKIYTVQKAEK